MICIGEYAMVSGNWLSLEVAMFRSIRNALPALAAGLLAACAMPSPPTSPPKSFADALAERNYVIGADVDRVPGLERNSWEPVDGEHIIVLDTDARGYLVTLTQRCYGLQGNRLQHRARISGALSPADEIEVKHEGRTVDHCFVERLQRLEPLDTEKMQGTG